MAGGESGREVPSQVSQGLPSHHKRGASPGQAKAGEFRLVAAHCAAAASARLRSNCLPTTMKTTAATSVTTAVTPKNVPGGSGPRFSSASGNEPPYIGVHTMLRKFA